MERQEEQGNSADEYTAFTGKRFRNQSRSSVLYLNSPNGASEAGTWRMAEWVKNAALSLMMKPCGPLRADPDRGWLIDDQIALL